MIRLIAPPPENPNTGGYLVNARLSEDPRIEQCFSLHRNLEDAVGKSGCTPVIDSLYLLHEPVHVAADVVLLAHSLPSFFTTSTDQRLAIEEQERLILPRFRGIIAPSEFMAGELSSRGVATERIRVVTPAPVVDGRVGYDGGRDSTQIAPDLPSEIPDSPKDIEVLTVANWSRTKGIADAASALSQLADLRWSWTVIGRRGDGDSYGREVRDIMESNRVLDRVSARESLEPERLGRVYACADIFLLPSLIESYGLVFAEAATFGVPTVGYRAGAVGEAVCGTGSLVEPGNWRALVPVLRRLMEDRSLCLEEGARARAAAERLPTWPTVRDRFIGAATSLWENGAAA